MSPRAQAAAPSLVVTITTRLVATTLVIMLLQAVIVGLRDYANQTVFLNNFVRREALRLGDAVIASLTHPGARISPLLPRHYTGPEGAGYAFRVFDAAGHVLAEQNADRLAGIVPRHDAASPESDFWMRRLDPVERMQVAGGLRLQRADRDVRIEFATFGDPANTYVASLSRDILDDVWVPIFPLVLLTTLVAAVSVSASLRPLVTAARQADAIAALERGDRLDVAKLPAEASQFASAINRLLDRVTDLVAAQRQFIARAAHELRTPLSIMMLEVGHLDRPGTGKRLEADIVSLSNIVEQLLTLSRLTTLAQPAMQPLHLARVTRDVVERVREWAGQDGHALSLDDGISASNAAGIVVGDETSVRAAIRNLIENAVRHTPAGTRVRVALEQPATIAVEDAGPGLDPSLFEELQLPFRKGDAASSGAGLGLAIVRQVAEGHGARLEIGRSSLGGARFVLHFPPRSQAKPQPQPQPQNHPEPAPPVDAAPRSSGSTGGHRLP